MTDLASRIIALYKAETGVTLRVTMSFEAGVRVPWRATIGVYNSEGTDPYRTLESLLTRLEETLRTKRRMHNEAVALIDDTLNS